MSATLDENWRLDDDPKSETRGLWVNKTAFGFTDEHGRHQWVPAGVRRPAAEAEELERHRPTTEGGGR